jgi:hypothetical protein
MYNNFEYLLNTAELERLKYYEELWLRQVGTDPRKDAEAIVHLGDNPWGRICWSKGGKFPSLRRSMGLLFHIQSGTVLTPNELLAIQGWPTFSSLSNAAGIGPLHFPDFNLRRVTKYAGNAYHVALWGMWWTVCLACVKEV